MQFVIHVSIEQYYLANACAILQFFFSRDTRKDTQEM